MGTLGVSQTFPLPCLAPPLELPHALPQESLNYDWIRFSAKVLALRECDIGLIDFGGGRDGGEWKVWSRGQPDWRACWR